MRKKINIIERVEKRKRSGVSGMTIMSGAKLVNNLIGSLNNKNFSNQQEENLDLENNLNNNNNNLSNSSGRISSNINLTIVLKKLDKFNKLYELV